jgi:hypothetical protein
MQPDRPTKRAIEAKMGRLEKHGFKCVRHQDTRKLLFEKDNWNGIKRQTLYHLYYKGVEVFKCRYINEVIDFYNQNKDYYERSNK